GAARTEGDAQGPDGGAPGTHDSAPGTDRGALGSDGVVRNMGTEAANAYDRRGNADPRSEGASGPNGAEHPVRAFFRANPQVLVLLVICLVLGLGTFFVVLLGLVTAGSDQTTGEPSGAVLGAHSPAMHLLAALFG